MATTIIACTGEGQAWVHPEELPEGDERDVSKVFVCPGCELEPGMGEGQLGIKVRIRNGKVSPTTVPEHDIEVEGSELRFVLDNGEFKVHTKTCPTLKRDAKVLSDGEKPGVLVALDKRDAVLQLWDDQILESDEIADKDEPTEAELLPYYGYTEFHRCVNKLFGATDEKPKSAAVKRDSKRALATIVVEAIAAGVVAALDAEPGNKSADAVLVLAGMDRAEALRTTSQWIHHLPADRDRWLATELPKPERSDWLPKETEASADSDSDEEEDGEDAA